MNIPATTTTDFDRSLEQFRHLLFHLQMECGSLNNLLRFFNTEEDRRHFDALKALDPNLMPQLLAREYVLEARQAKTMQTARQHLELALRLDPRCPEACLELATLSETPESAMNWFQKSMDATAALLGEQQMAELFEQFRQQPWQQVEIHTWFKAKAGLAETLFRAGYNELAIFHFQELLALEPADEMNIHHFLATTFLCENRLEDASRLLAQFPEDFSAPACYLRTALRFKLDGDTGRARRSLLKAFRRNLWTSAYLLGLAEMPQANGKLAKSHPAAGTAKKSSRDGRSAWVGSRWEAVDCVHCIAPVFSQDAKLTWWLRDILKSVAMP